MMGFVVGQIIGVVVAVPLVALVIRRFPERWRASRTLDFVCPLTPDVVFRRLVAYTTLRRRWRVSVLDPRGGVLQIRCSVTWLTWAKRIDVTVQAWGDSQSTVLLRSSSPQLVDWGDNRRAVEAIRAAVTSSA